MNRNQKTIFYVQKPRTSSGYEIMVSNCIKHFINIQEFPKFLRKRGKDVFVLILKENFKNLFITVTLYQFRGIDRIILLSKI